MAKPVELTQRPQPASPPQPQAPQVPGRFVGLEAVGRELYQTVLLETLDGRVVRREVVESGREEERNGRVVRGASLAVAMGALSRAVAKRLRDVGQLWRP